MELIWGNSSNDAPMTRNNASTENGITVQNFRGPANTAQRTTLNDICESYCQRVTRRLTRRIERHKALY